VLKRKGRFVHRHSLSIAAIGMHDSWRIIQSLQYHNAAVGP
jgi:hypothetical protein